MFYMSEQVTQYDTVLKSWNHFFAYPVCDDYAIRDELGIWMRNERNGVKQNKQSLLTPRRAYNAYHIGQFQRKAMLYMSLAFDYPCFKAGHEWGNWGVEIPMPDFPDKSRLVDKPTDLLPEYYHSLQSWMKECEEKIKSSIPRISCEEIWNDISLEQLILPFGFGFYIGDYSLNAAKHLYFLIDQGLHLPEFKWDNHMSISLAGKLIEFILDRQKTFDSISTLIGNLGFLIAPSAISLADSISVAHSIRDMYIKSNGILREDPLYACDPIRTMEMDALIGVIDFSRVSFNKEILSEDLKMNFGTFLSNLPSHSKSLRDCFRHSQLFA